MKLKQGRKPVSPETKRKSNTVILNDTEREQLIKNYGSLTNAILTLVK